MTKQQAAEALGVTTRAVERYTSRGILSVKYTKGKTNDVAVYDAREVARLGEKLARPKRPASPAIVRDAPRQSPNGNHDGSTGLATLPANTSAASTATALNAVLPLLERFVAATESVKESSGRFWVEEVRTLTLPEASELSGVPRSWLVRDREQLRARKVGRAWRIRPSDLKLYVDSLWS